MLAYLNKLFKLKVIDINKILLLVKLVKLV